MIGKQLTKIFWRKSYLEDITFNGNFRKFKGGYVKTSCQIQGWSTSKNIHILNMGQSFSKKIHPLDITVTRLVGKPNNLDNLIQQQS